MALLDLFSRPNPSTAAFLNAATFDDYYERLRLLATSVFKWEGLPPEIDVRYLEQALFMTGRCLFFRNKKDPAGSSALPPIGAYMALQCTPGADLNVYNVPTCYTATSHIYNQDYGLAESVLIRNNYDMAPTSMTVLLFAERLAQAERIIDTNVKAQRIPLFIRTDKKSLVTLLNVFKKYEGNEPCIVVDKALDRDMLEVFQTNAPYNEDKLTVYKHNLWNEAMTFLGINNANTDKKERLIQDEANSNNGQIAASAQVMLFTRQDAAEQINQMFGLNVSVALRDNPVEAYASNSLSLDPGEADPAVGPAVGPAEKDGE